MDRNDTIAAIATPIGQGGIGIVRMSGQDAIRIISLVFDSKTEKSLLNAPSHTLHYGHIIDIDNGKLPVDEVLVSIMKSPRTYTKEDIVEISCHGSYIILQKILLILINKGARLAEPGEFTKRAFLNGRMDLTQAEAVIDLINAKTDDASKSALKHLEGYLSIYIKKLQDSVKEILVDLETHIDFVEDVGKEFDWKKCKFQIEEIFTSLNRLIKTYSQGKMLKDGIGIAIIGKTNVGKSSLFNILIDSPSRAIVSDVHGTTRDFLDENVNVSGRLFRFMDTAGFKIPRGVLDNKSLGVTNKCINDANIILFVLDGSKPLSKKDLEIWSVISAKSCVIVINKIDLPVKISNKKIETLFNDRKTVKVSCKNNTGIQELKDKIIKLVKMNHIIPANGDIVITNVRHKYILEKTSNSIKDAICAIDKGLSVEFITTDLKHALEYLQELTGEKITETILEDIFSKFCIGK